MSTSITKPRRLALGAAVLGVALLLAGCSAAAAPAAPAATQARQVGGQGGQGGQGGAGGGIFGQIAAVTGTTLQVQSSTAQTAVTVAPTTTVLQTAKGSIADVTVGSCVVASSFGGAATGSTPAPSGGAVSSVAITPAVNGACTGGFGGGFRGGAGTRPSGRPSASPRPSAPRNRSFTPPVAGAVTGVSGSTITVSVDANGTKSSKTVTTGATTTFTLTAKATSAALVVGKCASVRGPADSAGTVTATSVTVSDPGASGCTAPFGRGGGFGGTPSSPQSGASGPNA